MARPAWLAVTVRSDPVVPGQEIADACAKLTSAGWTPTFIVPVWAGTVQVIATRAAKDVMPPRLPFDPGVTTDPGLDLKAPSARPKKAL